MSEICNQSHKPETFTTIYHNPKESCSHQTYEPNLNLKSANKHSWYRDDISQICKNNTGVYRKTFFQNVFEIFTCSGFKRRPKHDVAFKFSLNETVFPWLYVEVLKNKTFSRLHFLLHWLKKLFISKRLLSYNKFSSGIVSSTWCCLQIFPWKHSFPVT